MNDKSITKSTTNNTSGGQMNSVGTLSARHLTRLLGFIAVISLAACSSIKPQPFEKSALAESAADLDARVTANQEPVSGRIDLYEAMARALKYNLDKRVEMMTEAVRHRELDVEHYNRLPQLVANVGYNGRSNQSGARSLSLISGQESLEPSTSSEKNSITADLTVSWDVLDFGLSYARARQKADEVLIAQERKRKVVNRIVEDVRTAYWRAVSSERLIKELERLQSAIQTALDQSRGVSKDANLSPLNALTYQRELINMQRDIQKLHRELNLSKLQLSSLMNLRPGTPFELVIPERAAQPPNLTTNRNELFNFALANRPELREVNYRKRINHQEARVTYLKMLPSLRAFAGLNYDTNDYLYKNNWIGWGAKASWNLLRVFSYSDDKALVKAQDGLLDQRALALAMAVMTQVHVGLARYDYLANELKTAGDYHNTQSEIYRQIMASYDSGRVSRQTLIRERMNKAISDVKYDIAYADLQNAYANVFAAIGADPFDADLRGDEPVVEMAASLRSLWLSRGDTRSQ